MANTDPSGHSPQRSASAHSRAESPAAGVLRSRLSRVWQLPLLIVSLAAFGYGGYRLIDPKPPPTLDQRLDSIAKLIDSDKGEPAAESLRAILAEDDSKTTPPQLGRTHLLLATAVAQVQHARRIDIPANHRRIIESTKLAEQNGIKLQSGDFRRLAESYEALGKGPDALAAYRNAIAAAPQSPDAVPLHRKVIELLTARGDQESAETELKAYLADKRLSRSEKAWALGERSRFLADQGNFPESRQLVHEAIDNERDPVLLGQLNYRLGYLHWRLTEDDEAERYLRVARDQLKSHPQDADAAFLLGTMLQKHERHPEAISFFQAVLANHADSPIAPKAKLGRGVSRIESSQDDAGLSDLHDCASDVVNKPAHERYRPDALAAVRRAGKTLTAHGNLDGALELMSLEQSLEPTPAAEFFSRLSQIYEKRGDQLEKAAAAMPDGAKRVKTAAEGRVLIDKAGDAAIAQSRGLVANDDRGYGLALWRGIDLYDRSGSLQQAVAALELFIAERPEDPVAPDALLRLGKTFHAMGQFDKAIDSFQRNQLRYPQSLAASKSGVPLAQAYLAKGPEYYAKAEWALNATLGNIAITPEAEEFRQALFELANLCYRTGRFEEAVQRLQELTDRYPDDPRRGQLLFLMADSYRKSAALLAAELKAAKPVDPANAGEQVAIQAERLAAKNERLARARRLYDQVIDYFQVQPPRDERDKLQLKLSHFYRADCVYDTGRLEEAIKLYDAAALRYQDDPASLAAYVQIVNAYSAMGRPQEAKAANERAKWLLQRLPAEAFKDANQAMPARSWEQWIQWSKTAGLW